jgi:DNA-binding transcriptional MerR regulator
MNYEYLSGLSGFELRKIKKIMEQDRDSEEREVRYAVRALKSKLQDQLEKVDSGIRNRELLNIVERCEDTVAMLNKSYSNIMRISHEYIETSRTIIDIENILSHRDGQPLTKPKHAPVSDARKPRSAG